MHKCIYEDNWSCLSKNGIMLYSNLIFLPESKSKIFPCQWPELPQILVNRYVKEKIFQTLIFRKCGIFWGEIYLRKVSKNEHTSIPDSLIKKKGMF